MHPMVNSPHGEFPMVPTNNDAKRELWPAFARLSTGRTFFALVEAGLQPGSVSLDWQDTSSDDIYPDRVGTSPSFFSRPPFISAALG